MLTGIKPVVCCREIGRNRRTLLTETKPVVLVSCRALGRKLRTLLTRTKPVVSWCVARALGKNPRTLLTRAKPIVLQDAREEHKDSVNEG